MAEAWLAFKGYWLASQSVNNGHGTISSDGRGQPWKPQWLCQHPVHFKFRDQHPKEPLKLNDLCSPLVSGGSVPLTITAVLPNSAVM